LFFFSLGGGSLFDGSVLASEGDIIVITMNFRLNYHGFLSSGDDRVKGIHFYFI
jgi:carboxylesterase type B